MNLFADSIWYSSTGSGGSSLLVTFLSKKRFVPSCTCGFYLARRPVICYTCVDLSSASRPPPPPRSIVFVLYVNVYQRVPTVSASTYKVMYWHGRLLGDRAELTTYRGCAAEGRPGRWGNTAVTAWEEEAVLITCTLPLTQCYVSECTETREVHQRIVKTWNFPDPGWMLVNLLWKTPFHLSETQGMSVRTFKAANKRNTSVGCLIIPQIYEGWFASRRQIIPMNFNIISTF